MSAHNKLAIPNRAGGAIPQAGGGSAIYVPGQDGGARLQVGDMGLSGALAGARAEAQGAEGIARLGQALDGAVQKGLGLYEKYQAAMAQNAFNEYEREEMLQRAELDKLSGENALGENGVKAQFAKWRAGARERLTQNLAPIARDMFMRQADQTDAKSDVWTLQKEDRELKIFENKASEGTILNAQNAVLQNPGDEAQMARSAGIIKGELARQGERNGWGPEYVTAKTDEATRKLAGQRIGAMIDAGDLDGAERAIKGMQQGRMADTAGMDGEVVRLIRELSPKYRMDPELMLAISKAESGGKVKAATSRAGAVGPMQLIPKWARKAGFDPYDLRQNIEGGISEFADLLKKYGNEEEALIAYNWGQGNWDAYKKKGKGLYGQDRPEESLNYVKAVYRHMRGGMLTPGNAGKFQKMIDNERKRRAAEAKRAEIERLQAQYGQKEDIKLRFADAIAAFENGVAPDDLPANDELVYAYGKQYPKIVNRISAARNYCDDLQLLPELDNKMQEQLLKERKPQPGEGYAIQAKYYQQLQQAMQADQKKRKEDAVAYVIGHDEELAQAKDAFMEQQTPENWQKFRNRLDVNLAARQMPLEKKLSKNMATALADTLKKSKNPLQLKQEWQKALGNDFSAVFNQISPGMGEGTRIALAAAGSKDRQGHDAAERLMEIERDKDWLKKVKPLIPEWVNLGDSLINSYVADACSEFNSTLLASQFTNTPDMAIAAQNTVRKYGAWLMLNEGMTAKNAFNKAADIFFNDRYEFNEVNGKSFRVPKSGLIDNDRVVSGLKPALEQVAANMDDYMTAGGGKFTDRKAFADIIMSKGYFVTDEKEGGLKFFVQGYPLFHAKGPKKGKAVSFDWGTLMGMRTPQDLIDELEDN